MATHANTAFAPLVFTAMFVRPVESVLHSARVLAGASAFAFRYSPASLLVILLAWFTSTLMFDVLRPPATPAPWWVGPALELAFWTVALRFTVKQPRYWRTLAAVASMSTLIWLAGCALVISDAHQDLLAIVLVSLAVRGYTVILAESWRDGVGDALPLVIILLLTLATGALVIRGWMT